MKICILFTMEGLSSQINILKLCEYIIDAIESKDQDDLTVYINGLKFICYGEPKEGCLSLLTPQEKLASILRISNFNVSFAMQSDDCINAVEALLSYPHLTFDVSETLRTLLHAALKMNFKRKLLTFNKLFTHKNFPLFPVDLIEEIITLDSTQLELHIIGLYTERCNNARGEIQFWNSDRSKHWVSWCSTSPKLFCILTSLMNQMLLIVKNRKAILEIILNFIANICRTCHQEGLDFVRLYPIKLQFLVNLMSLDVEQMPAQFVHQISKHIFEQICILKKENVFHAILLLTHFNKWENYFPIKILWN